MCLVLLCYTAIGKLPIKYFLHADLVFPFINCNVFDIINNVCLNFLFSRLFSVEINLLLGYFRDPYRQFQRQISTNNN